MAISKINPNSLGGVPAFSAYVGTAQTITAGVITNAQFTIEVFDTNSRFNNTGSTVNGIPAYAFMPDVAGYYQLSWNLYINTGSGINLRSYLYKNGSTFLNGSFVYSVTMSDIVSSGSAVVYLNGSTDYVQVYGGVLSNMSGTPSFNNGQVNSAFSGALVRAA